LRVLQFMAAGLPVVANSVGMNRRMVIPDETGVLADAPAQWAAAIEQLAADPPRRSRLGAAGRRQVEQRYNVRGWKDPFADFVANVVCGQGLPDAEVIAFPSDATLACQRRSWRAASWGPGETLECGDLLPLSSQAESDRETCFR
jgi:hypothetical protein